MSEKLEISELDDALIISRKLREEILADKGSIDSHLLSFYTVSQILERKENIEWAEREIGGYASEDEYPKYRHVYANIMQSNRVVGSISNLPAHPEASYLSAAIKLKTKGVWNANKSESMLKRIENEIGTTPKGDYVFEIPLTEFASVITSIRLEMIKRLNLMIKEISYGKIPKSIFQKFQRDVNLFLVKSNSEAIEVLEIAIESLGHSENPERASQVAHACKRLIKAVADELFPAQKEDYEMKGGESMQVGDEKSFNRLIAFIDNRDSKKSKRDITKNSFVKKHL